jgi:alkylation response protein AidB-like acyl-CoA dehydrogenase
MNLAPTDEQLALRDTVRRFLADRAPVAGYVRPRLDGPADPAGRAASGPGPAWAGLAALGTTGVLVPEAHGGAGLTMVEAGIVAEELGRMLHPGPWVSSAVAAVRALTHIGAPPAGSDAGGVDGRGEGVDRDAVDELLAAIAAGSTIAAVAFAERRPGASVPAWARPATRAARPAAERNGRQTLTGEKVDVPDATAATVLLVLAADDGGAALYAVDPDDTAVEITPQHALDPTRPQYRVRLDAVPARRIGPADPAAVVALVDDVLAVRAADALGSALAVPERAPEHAKVRTQFGRPIGAFQAVQHLCVDMHETVELARGGVMHALWAAERAGAERAVRAERAGAEERHLAAIRAKAFSGRLATVGDTAIQVLGGIGFTWEHDAHLHLRRLLAWRAYLGAPGPYLREIGAQLAADATRARPRPMRSPA